MTDVMVDLETCDTRSSAIILSIGACSIDWDHNDTRDHFYRVISVDSCKAVGLTESRDTMNWWAKQSEEARRVFKDPEAMGLVQALTDFSSYMRSFGVGTVKLWGCGSDFDNAILQHAFDVIGADAPWRFWNNRCYRTARDLVGKARWVELDREGTYHNALDDAVHQARCMIRNKVRG